jgi:TolB-like protein/tetratricopeptide (TPR) repeat protein
VLRQASVKLLPMIVRFGPFELDRAAGELRKGGSRLRLQDKPLRVLEALVERAGALVTREELRRQLWSDDTFVDFDNSLNNAINRLRAALADEADKPRFVETVGRRGYRFVAQVVTEFAPAPDKDQQPSARPSRTRLVVLPFRILRSDPETDFLASSLPDAIAASLSGLESLLVRSTLAAARFASEAPDLRTIAAELDVNVVLAGSILRDARRLRITTQLVEAPAGALVWTHTSEVSPERIFELQDDVARRIVESLSVPLSVRDHRMLGHDVPASGKAYEQYLRANRLSETGDTWSAARDLYLESIRGDPDYAPAWARLGRMYRLMAKYGAGDARECGTLAEESFTHALALNPELSVAHHFYAQLDLDLGRPREALVRLLGRAREHQADPQLFAGLVQACRYCGLVTESLVAHRRARVLDPNLSTSVSYTHWAIGDYAAALDAIRTDNDGFRGVVLAALNRRDEALVALDESERRSAGHSTQIAYIELVRASLLNDPATFQSRIERILRSSFRDPEGFIYIAIAAMWMKEPAMALTCLARAVDQGFACFPHLVREPAFEPLRGEQGFVAVLVETKQRHDAAVGAFIAARGPAIL